MPSKNSISKYDWQYILTASLLILIFIFTDVVKVFDKAFYKTFNSKLCKHCGGDGQIEVEEYFPRGFNNDIGIIGTKFIECDECYGTGKIDGE